MNISHSYIHTWDSLQIYSIYTNMELKVLHANLKKNDVIESESLGSEKNTNNSN